MIPKKFYSNKTKMESLRDLLIKKADECYVKYPHAKSDWFITSSIITIDEVKGKFRIFINSNYYSSISFLPIFKNMKLNELQIRVYVSENIKNEIDFDNNFKLALESFKINECKTLDGKIDAKINQLFNLDALCYICHENTELQTECNHYICLKCQMMEMNSAKDSNNLSCGLCRKNKYFKECCQMWRLYKKKCSDCDCDSDDDEN